MGVVAKVILFLHSFGTESNFDIKMKIKRTSALEYVMTQRHLVYLHMILKVVK